MNEEKMAQAERWLERALQYEAENKAPGLVDKALQKACDLEKEVLAEPSNT